MIQSEIERRQISFWNWMAKTFEVCYRCENCGCRIPRGKEVMNEFLVFCEKCAYPGLVK